MTTALKRNTAFAKKHPNISRKDYAKARRLKRNAKRLAKIKRRKSNRDAHRIIKAKEYQIRRKQEKLK